jgi:hypothetical protein
MTKPQTIAQRLSTSGRLWHEVKSCPIKTVTFSAALNEHNLMLPQKVVQKIHGPDVSLDVERRGFSNFTSPG